MTKYYIGFDCGTQGTKVAIYADDATLAAESYVEHDISYPRPGWVEMHPDTFYRAVTTGIAQCVRQSKIDPQDVRGIACSGILCGWVPIDANWNPVGPYILYLDTRSTAEAQEIQNTVEPLWIEESGNVDIDTFVAPVILRWMFKHQPDVIARTRKFLTAAHYVTGKLGGLRAAEAYIDWTHLSGWIIGYNAHTRDWSDTQLDLLGIPREIVPQVKKPWDVVGTLTQAQAAQLGLRAGIPLIAGAGDIMQSNLGSGIVETGICSDVAGTASIFSVEVPELNPTITRIPGLLFSNCTLEDHYIYWGYIRAGGLSLRWYRDGIDNRNGEDSFYHAMDALAEQVPLGADLTLFYPYLQGGDPSLPNASGTWLNLRGSTNRATLWRSMLEAIAFEYLSHALTFRHQGINITEVIGTGGGSKSRLWNQIKADMLGATYVTLKRSEGAVLGNALLAAYGVGDIPDLPAAVRQWVEVRERFVPRPAYTETYRKIHASRQAILNGPLREIFRLFEELQEV